ncbi:uncharacterized protein LOC127658608 [Xyrauchen texanus]|uniref:uncharacterized protein LOC127658608 n=1 Tax=Xyrauchen texanus TaxID=154827 RepID=UPI00224260BC|nr:uncharacterized protein LOC127658608 [Xyrauchen texanus]
MDLAVSQANCSLLSLMQGSRPVEHHIRDFLKLARVMDFPDSLLVGFFWANLNDRRVGHGVLQVVEGEECLVVRDRVVLTLCEVRARLSVLSSVSSGEVKKLIIFEKPSLTINTHSDLHFTQTSTLSATTLLLPPATEPELKICEEDVCQVFRKQKTRKAQGPDDISPTCLKFCADQLATIFTQIFNRSLEQCEVPCCFKHSTIIPVPKKPQTTGLNDYRPVAVMSVVMKSFERLVSAHLKDITGPFLYPL